MLIRCPSCGAMVPVNGLGRKRLVIPLRNIIDCLQIFGNIGEAAKKLSCSPAYICSVLKSHGLKLKEAINGNNDKE
jgi:hypothetical protein